MHFPKYLTLLLAFLALTPAMAQKQSPNIVLILADDMGKECIGTYGAPTKPRTSISSRRMG
jgi:arylsulfatase A